MSEFFISDRETQQAREDAALSAEQEQQGRPLFGGEWPVLRRSAGAQVTGAYAKLAEGIYDLTQGDERAAAFRGALAREGAAATRPGAAFPEYTDTQEDWWERFTRQTAERARSYSRNYAYRPDPRTLSHSAEIIGNVGGILAAAILAGPIPTAFEQGRQAEADALEADVDVQTAREQGLAVSVGTSALFSAPAALPGSLLRRMASGAAINLAGGAGLRAASGGILEDHPEAASAYDWADPTAAITDALIGAAFGVLPVHHTPPARERTLPNPETGQPEIVETRPVTADEWLHDARSFANDMDPDFVEAYAHALIAEDLGHAEAHAVVVALEETAPQQDLDEGRALASEYAAAELGRSLPHSELADAALIQQDALHREINTAPGIPADSSARRAHSEALSMAEEQAARDEEIDVVSTRVDEEEFIQRDPIEDAELNAIMRQELEDTGLDAAAAEAILEARLREEEAISRGIDPGAMFSFGPRRDEVMGPRAFVKNALRNEGWRAEVDEQGVSVADIAARDGVHVGIVYRALNQARALPENVRSNLHEEINKVSRELENERGTKANDYSRQAVARLLEHAETVARANGGRLPHGYSGALADASGYAVHSVESMMSLARKGKYGADYQARANAIGKGVTGAKPTNRQVIGALMDQGLSIPQITQRLNGIRQDMGLEPTTENTVGATMSQIRKARREGDVRFSRTDRTGFSSPEELEYRAELMFGASWEALSRAGYARIVQSSADVPGGLTGIPRGVKAVHLRETGESYFIANNIRPDELKGLILHEIGVHHGMEAMLGKRGWNTILRQVDRMVEAENPAAMEARSYVESRYREADVGAETVAYIVEFHADHPLTLSILARVRQWLVKTFGSTFGLRLTVDDIRALALASLKRVAEQARRESQPVTEVRPAFDPARSGESDLLASFGDPKPPRLETIQDAQTLDRVTPRSFGAINKITPRQLAVWFFENVDQHRTADGGVSLHFRSEEGLKNTNVKLELRDDGRDGVIGVTVFRGRVSRETGWRAPTRKEVAKALHLFTRLVAVTRHWVAENKPERLSFTGASDAHERLYRTMLRQIHIDGYEAREVILRTANVEKGSPNVSVVRDVRSQASDPATTFMFVRSDIAAQEPVGEKPVETSGVAYARVGEVSLRKVQANVILHRREGQIHGRPDQNTGARGTNAGGDGAGRNDAGRDAGGDQDPAAAERLKAEEAHAKLSPEEQALADNPGMSFSYGKPERDASDYPLPARELYDAAKTEEKVAREMGGAIDAAARCGARYAGQGFARGASFLTLNAGARAGAQAMMGQALGLTTAVPVGILATPMLARNASLLSPENNYLRNVADPAQYEHGKGIPFSEAASSDEDFVERPDPAMSMGDVLDIPAGVAPGRTPGRGKAPPAPASFKVDE